MKACFEAFGGAETIYGITGIQHMPFNTLFQFYAMAQRDEPALKAGGQFLFAV